MTTQPAQTAVTPAAQKRSMWVSFTYLATWSYVLYGLGIATPYLRDDLRLTAFQAGLHASALAGGVLIAGVSTDRLARLVGIRWLPGVELAVIGLGIAMFALAPGLAISLAGAIFIGLGGSIVVTDVNVRLSRVNGTGSHRLLAQAYGLSMIMAGIAPLAIGLAASQLHSWRIALALPVAAFAALTALRSSERDVASAETERRHGRLPAAYWVTWFLIILCVSVEFSFVYWGSTLVDRRTGIGASDATILASLFVLGMFLGRTAIGLGFGTGRSPRALLGGSLIVALIGGSLAWISAVPALSGLGLLLGGLGTAALFPVTLNVALQMSPKAQIEASARMSLASGIAILVAPSALGLAADAVGVVGAWTIMPGLAIAALVVVVLMPGPEPTKRFDAEETAADAAVLGNA
jgi:predicted MFS family arabinose efflux permease